MVIETRLQRTHTFVNEFSVYCYLTLSLVNCQRQGVPPRSIVVSRFEDVVTPTVVLNTPDVSTSDSAVPPLPSEPIVVVSHPQTLEQLEQHGFDFGSVLNQSSATNTQQLYQHRWYRELVDQLSRDLQRTRHGDHQAGEGVHFNHRLFVLNWLHSTHTRFELVGVVNRIDRHPFYPDHCGEVRLIYRLRYHTTARSQQVASRLPMTVNVVFWQDSSGPSQNCSEVARRWMIPNNVANDPVLLAGYLTEATGPLSGTNHSRIKSVEYNFQSVRWPSALLPGLAGHAEYPLRVLNPTESGEHLTVATLENTPDVGRLLHSTVQRQALLSWLIAPEQLRKIDDGTLVIADEYLTSEAVSIAPRGLSRIANRPFSQLFTTEDFASVDFSQRRVVRSAPMLLRTLDQMTCVGCHQSMSVAGFHWLGLEREQSDVNAIAVAFSPHVAGDLPRRRDVLSAMAQEHAVDFSRALAERTQSNGQYGTHCGRPGSSFAEWQCERNLHCVFVNGNDVGVCLNAPSALPGDACEVGNVRSTVNARTDGAQLNGESACSQGECLSNRAGFPAGLCISECVRGNPTSIPETVCGLLPALEPFNQCLARGGNFEGCITSTSAPTLLRQCDQTHLCRDDYVCAQMGTDTAGCVPPYFLFQLRVDGHPNFRE